MKLDLMIVPDMKPHLTILQHMKPHLIILPDTKPHLIILPHMKPHSMTLCMKETKVEMTLNLWLEKMATTAVGHATSLNLVCLI